ncbi:MAG: glucose-6-phosphate isomerase [Phycisphaerales bacterium]|nr:MAG: glucose-6-phosphate isomerase [Phycisphaerales bacterium]
MLKIDYTNCLSNAVAQHGLDAATFDPKGPNAARMAELTRSLTKSRGTGWERWRNLWTRPTRDEHTSAIKKIVAERAGRFENLVVLGIGGSALGNIALQSALNPSTHNLLPADKRRGPRLFVLDNVDPDAFHSALSFCESCPGGIKSTLFNVVSKSGETAETAAQFMIIRDRLKAVLGKDYASHIVATTDPAKGTMRKICNDEGFVTLPVPDGVGGRFSALSPVGLFSASMCGIDIDALLDGAAAMDDRCSRESLNENPAATLALLLVELGKRGKPNHVLMPYANALYLLADWYRQLWAESLGKEKNTRGETVFTGFTPIKALGATDQHSQIQLYREGPNDKVVGLIEVESFAAKVDMPRGLGVEALAYLEGKPMSALLNAELKATAYALTHSKRPNYTIRFPRIDEHHVGEFMALWQIATAYAGLMLGIDAYDQPAVELGKQATFALMGRTGYEQLRGQLDSATVARHIV